MSNCRPRAVDGGVMSDKQEPCCDFDNLCGRTRTINWHFFGRNQALFPRVGPILMCGIGCTPKRVHWFGERRSKLPDWGLVPAEGGMRWEGVGGGLLSSERCRPSQAQCGWRRSSDSVLHRSSGCRRLRFRSPDRARWSSRSTQPAWAAGTNPSATVPGSRPVGRSSRWCSAWTGRVWLWPEARA